MPSIPNLRRPLPVRTPTRSRHRGTRRALVAAAAFGGSLTATALPTAVHAGVDALTFVDQSACSYLAGTNTPINQIVQVEITNPEPDVALVLAELFVDGVYQGQQQVAVDGTAGPVTVGVPALPTLGVGRVIITDTAGTELFDTGIAFPCGTQPDPIDGLTATLATTECVVNNGQLAGQHYLEVFNPAPTPAALWMSLFVDGQHTQSMYVGVAANSGYGVLRDVAPGSFGTMVLEDVDGVVRASTATARPCEPAISIATDCSGNEAVVTVTADNPAIWAQDVLVSDAWTFGSGGSTAEAAPGVSVVSTRTFPMPTAASIRVHYHGDEIFAAEDLALVDAGECGVATTPPPAGLSLAAEISCAPGPYRVTYTASADGSSADLALALEVEASTPAGELDWDTPVAIDAGSPAVVPVDMPADATEAVAQLRDRYGRSFGYLVTPLACPAPPTPTTPTSQVPSPTVPAPTGPTTTVPAPGPTTTSTTEVPTLPTTPGQPAPPTGAAPAAPAAGPDTGLVLPATGDASGTIAVIALLALVAGRGLLAVSRRRG